MYLNFQKSWNFFIFYMKFLKFIKIELETSVMHQNWAKFMQNLTSWWQNMIFYQKKLILKGGSNLTPPRYTSIKIDVGIRRVKGTWIFRFGPLFFSLNCRIFKNVTNSTKNNHFVVVFRSLFKFGWKTAAQT